MPNKYADDSTEMLLRMPKELKRRLYAFAEEMNRRHPGANYSASSVARLAIESFLEKDNHGFVKDGDISEQKR